MREAVKPPSEQDVDKALEMIRKAQEGGGSAEALPHAGTGFWGFLMDYRIPRTIVTTLLFAQVLISYVWFALVSKPLTAKEKQQELIDQVHARNARRIYDSFVLLKGVYIKIGQFLSTQMALLPPVYLVEMTKMQDRVPRASVAQIRKRIIQEFGKPPEELLERFDLDPLACASIGQVHKVRFKGGRDGVLKIKYPGIDAKFHTDLNVINLMLPIFVRIIELAWYKEMSGIDHKKTIGEFVKYIRMELDYKNEIENHVKMRELLTDMRKQGSIIIPELLPEYCTNAIIGMEFIDGHKMMDWYSDSKVPGTKKDMVYRYLLDSSLYTITRHGFFQADTHPGNFMVFDKDPHNPDNKPALVMIDFGCAKQLPENFRIGVVEIINGYLTKNPDQITNALWDLDYRTKLHTKDSLKEWAIYGIKVTDIIVQHFNAGSDLIAHLKGNLRQMTDDFNAVDQNHRIDYIPEQYVMLGRILATPPIPIDKHQPKADLIGVIMPHMATLTMAANEDRKRREALTKSQAQPAATA